MYYIFYGVSGLFALLIGLFSYFYYRRVAAFWGMDVSLRPVRAGLIFLSVVIFILCINLFGTPALVLLHLTFFSIIFDLAARIGARISRHRNRQRSGLPRWQKLCRCGIVPVVITAVLIGYGFCNMNHILATQYTVAAEKKIPANGYRIVLLADVHYGSVLNAEKITALTARINSENPDLVVLCGDLVDEHTSLSEMNELFGILGTLQSTDGTVFVYGNHDRTPYTSKPNFSEEQLTAAILQNHITVLEDDVLNVNDWLTVAGRKDRSTPRKSVDSLLEGVDRSHYIMILDHQPNQYEQDEAAGADLVLSGHTHGGQIWPVGLISEAFHLSDQEYGRLKTGNMTAIVTSGAAGWGYPVRTESHSEYAVIDLQPAAF